MSPPVREHPAPSGAFTTLLHRSRSWSSAQVPRGGGRPVVPRADAPSALLRSPSAVRCAHKGPELGNAVRTQGRNQAVVCNVVLCNSVPCVRNRELCAKGGRPAPSGALRPHAVRLRVPALATGPGSTQHLQVRSRLCSIGAGRGPRPKCQRVEAGRRCGGASRGRAVSTHPVPFCCEVRTQGTRIRQRRSHTRAESSRCVRCCVA